MRAIVLVLLAASIPLAGCVGSAEGQEDPFAYMRKPLYASSFDLDRIGDEPDFQEFRITDGSILSVRMFVWINATEGDATVSFTNPSGQTVATFTQTGEMQGPVELGVWRVDVATGESGAAGKVTVKVVRG